MTKLSKTSIFNNFTLHNKHCVSNKNRLYGSAETKEWVKLKICEKQRENKADEGKILDRLWR